MIIKDVIDILVENFRPYSIFLYGSKATNSDNSKSDYEIGVIFEEDSYISRTEISNIINDNNYAIFPFRLNEVLNYDIDTPFQKNIYMSALINGWAKTLYGKSVIENLKSPIITTADLLADINFNLGVALSSVRVFKSGNVELANDMFYKSCFYVTRDLIYHSLQELCLSYNDIYVKSQEIDIPEEYRNLLETAYNLRNEKKLMLMQKHIIKTFLILINLF